MQYEGLGVSAESTLKTMEEQKTLFLESVAQAKKNLLMEILPSEEDVGAQQIMLAEEDDDFDVEQQRKQQTMLEALKAEEAALKGEIEELEKGLSGARLRIKEEKDKQKELREEIEKQKAEYEDIATQLEGDIPESLDAEEAQIAELQEENQQLLLKMEDLQKKLVDENRRADLEDQAAEAAEKAAQEEFQRKQEELSTIVSLEEKAKADAEARAARGQEPKTRGGDQVDVDEPPAEAPGGGTAEPAVPKPEKEKAGAENAEKTAGAG